MRTQTKRVRFNLGTVVATPRAAEAICTAKQTPYEFLARHVRGDWGEIPPEDWEENEFSICRDLRILSAYRTRCGARIWVITEADRSVTTLLLPEEY